MYSVATKYIFYYLKFKPMKSNIFGDLLEIKTGKKDLVMKAVYVSNSTSTWEWTYFIYYYDLLNHTFYINDLDNLCNYRTSAINIIEHIITEAYKQEKNSFMDTLITKKPKVYSFYRQKTWFIIIDKINLKTIRWNKWDILGFKNPTWDINDTNAVKLEKLKNNILNFYSKNEVE